MSDKRPTDDVSLRVRYADTDQMRVAYHANYLIWFEVGRTSYCRSCGITYAEMERHFNAFLPVIEVNCRYRTPLSYDQRFIVRTWIEQLRTRAISFGYLILDQDSEDVLAEGSTRHIVTDSDGQACRLPEALMTRLAATPESKSTE